MNDHNASVPSRVNLEEPEVSSTSYSSFSKAQKRWIVFLIAVAGMFSPLSSFIYYPALSAIAQDLNVTIEMVNLTITSYMIVSGVVPAFVGDTADQIGRRPVYMVTLLVYLAANIGLALQKSYVALLVLRMLQSIGSSGTISLGYGVVADIASPAERGSYVGAVLLGPNAAPSLGPVLGGVLAQFAGWRWIFWTLAILSGIYLMLMISFLPETARPIVGNGSIPAKGINRTFLAFFKRTPSPVANDEERIKKRAFRVPSLLPCLTLIFYKDTALILFINGILYTTYCCVQASLSTLFVDIYGFTELDAGLIYLPFGAGCLLASYTSGQIMNRDYRLVAEANNFVIDKTRGDNLSNFPIEKARLRSAYYFIAAMGICTVGYGWSLNAKTHIAIPLMLQFLIGGAITVLFNICGTLLVDIHPGGPSTATAAANIIRCALSAGGLAMLDVILSRLGIGWGFVFFAGFSMLTLPMVWAEARWGMEWRRVNEAAGGARKRERQAGAENLEKKREAPERGGTPMHGVRGFDVVLKEC